MLFFFWLVRIYLLSSWDEMDVGGKLLADDIWGAEDNKKGFLSVGVDILIEYIFVRLRKISLPMVSMSTIKQKYERWG